MVGRDLPFYQRLFDACTEFDGEDPPRPAAGDREGARHRNRRGMSARRRVRSRGCGRRRTVRDTRSQDRALLLDADGSALARDRQEACRSRCCSPASSSTRAQLSRVGARSIASCHPSSWTTPSRKLVGAIARSSPLTVGIGKEAFYAQVELDERINREANHNCTPLSEGRSICDVDIGTCESVRGDCARGI